MITGPPCGGKTTYLREHAKPGDIVVDFNAIARALGSPVSHDHAEPLRHVARMARNAAITEAAAQHRKGHAAWVIDSTPSPQRSRMYQSAHAVIVIATADPAELHRRASAERPERWHGLIDEWLAGHQQAARGPERAAEPVTASPVSSGTGRTW
ncbi:MAG: AAA family ATPase [Actinomycetota bacterium]|nr:AAA family ATPase [Actinomycetota bacterium]